MKLKSYDLGVATSGVMFLLNLAKSVNSSWVKHASSRQTDWQTYIM